MASIELAGVVGAGLLIIFALMAVRPLARRANGGHSDGSVAMWSGTGSADCDSGSSGDAGCGDGGGGGGGGGD